MFNKRENREQEQEQDRERESFSFVCENYGGLSLIKRAFLRDRQEPGEKRESNQCM